MCTEERTELWDRVGSSEVDSEVEGWDEEWEEWTICVKNGKEKEKQMQRLLGDSTIEKQRKHFIAWKVCRKIVAKQCVNVYENDIKV